MDTEAVSVRVKERAINWRKLTRRSVCNAIDLLEECVRERKTTTYNDMLAALQSGAEEGKQVGTAQRDNLLGTLTVLSYYHGLGYVSALVRLKDKPGLMAAGFFNYMATHWDREAVPENQREEWCELEAACVYKNADAVIDLLEYIKRYNA